ncbi:MAG TPA: indole-3-glycerol phosphate synthase TrpC [Candidatus Dormibacteraeota bacterium]|nr:indole-3-glycerol phosphate synthase TrpC [Candidatus Dormibacteraeota bacterium]
MILDDIIAARCADLVTAQRDTPLAALCRRPGWALPRRGFAATLRARRPAVIAEVKKASPSKGVIRADFDPVAIARRYAACGAAAISVLTEERYFQGSPAHLEAIRAAVDVPLLRKDFIVDSYQVAEARAWGADAILLIVAALDDATLRALHAAAVELGLDVLVEAHTGEEVDRAVAAGATLIGINNRDLRTFVTTLETAERLYPRLPAGTLAVAESGIETAADVARLRRAGYDVFLVGESLMRQPDPGAALQALLAEERR